MFGGSTLTLGADLAITGTLDIRGVNSVVNTQNHKITADTVFIGWYGAGGRITNRGGIVANNLYVNSQTFDLSAADAVANLYLSAAASTTAAGGNVTQNVQVFSGSTLTLGANLNLGTTGALDIRDANSGVNAQNRNVTAGAVYVGYYSSTLVALTNVGSVNVGNWYQAVGTQVSVAGGGSSLNNVNLTAASRLTIRNADGQTSGLTITSESTAALNISSDSFLRLQINGLASGYALRWANPNGGDHLADLATLISAGRIEFAYVNQGSFTLSSHDGYTFVNTVPVPEPGFLLALAAVPVAAAVRRRRAKAAVTGPAA